MPTNPISIIIPWIRKEKFERCLGCVISLWDLPKIYEIVAEEDKERIGAPKMVKKLVDRSKHDLVMFLGDDTVPRAGIFYHSLKAMDTFEDKWGLVGLNDGFHNPKHHATHWLAHKKLLSYLNGEFFHVGYWHCFCDNELILRCKELNRYVFAMEARLLHDNPIVLRGGFYGEKDNDPDYLRVYSAKWFNHDRWLFIRRRNNGWKSDLDVEKMKKTNNEIIRNSVWFWENVENEDGTGGFIVPPEMAKELRKIFKMNKNKKKFH